MIRTVLIVLMLGVSAHGVCASTESAPDPAKSYEQGDFDGALAAYEQAWEGGVRSPELLFNLGNAAYRTEQLGKAIAAYFAARELAPRDTDINENLRFVLRKLNSPVSFEQLRLSGAAWLRPITMLQLRESVWLAAVLWFLGLGGLVLRGFVKLPSWTSVIAGLLWLGSLYVFAGAYAQSKHASIAAVCAKSISVRSEAADNAQELTQLTEGTPVLLSTGVFKPGWIRIEPLTDALAGWVEGAGLCYYDVKTIF